MNEMIVTVSGLGNNIGNSALLVSLGKGVIQIQILLLDIMNFDTIKYVASNYVTANSVNHVIADVTTVTSLPT